MRHRWNAHEGNVCSKCRFTRYTVRWLKRIGHKHRCTGRESISLA